MGTAQLPLHKRIRGACHLAFPVLHQVSCCSTAQDFLEHHRPIISRMRAALDSAQRHASKGFPESALTRPATRRDTNTSRSSSTMTQAKSSGHMKGMARRSSPSSSSCSTRNSVPRYSWYQGMEPDGFRNASMNSVQRRNDASIRSMLSNGRRKPWTRCVALHGTMHGKAQRICLPRDVVVQRKVHRRQIQAPGI